MNSSVTAGPYDSCLGIYTTYTWDNFTELFRSVLTSTHLPIFWILVRYYKVFIVFIFKSMGSVPLAFLFLPSFSFFALSEYPPLCTYLVFVFHGHCSLCPHGFCCLVSHLCQSLPHLYSTPACPHPVTDMAPETAGFGSNISRILCISQSLDSCLSVCQSIKLLVWIPFSQSVLKF